MCFKLVCYTKIPEYSCIGSVRPTFNHETRSTHTDTGSDRHLTRLFHIYNFISNLIVSVQLSILHWFLYNIIQFYMSFTMNNLC